MHGRIIVIKNGRPSSVVNISTRTVCPMGRKNAGTYTDTALMQCSHYTLIHIAMSEHVVKFKVARCAISMN